MVFRGGDLVEERQRRREFYLRSRKISITTEIDNLNQAVKTDKLYNHFLCSALLNVDSCQRLKLGNFTKADGNENVKNAIGLISKTTPLRVHCTFWYISLPSLHDKDVKFPDRTFYGGRKQSNDDKFFFLFLNLDAVSKNSSSLHLTFKVSCNNRDDVEKTRNHFNGDVFAAVIVAKVPCLKGRR